MPVASTGTGDVGSLYISLGLDSSGLLQELVRSEQVASGTAGKIKDRLLTVGSALADIRKQAAQVKEALANAADFRVRGDAALDALHGQLDKVREAGAATDKTLDEISLSFEQAARGGKTYTQTLDKIASDKGATASVRELARALSDEAKEANLAVTALERQERAVNRQLSGTRREFTSLRKQAVPKEEHEVPEQAAASALVRGAEGQLSIRAGERFLTSTLGLGGALQTIFPVVGGLAMVDILSNLVDKTQEWKEKLDQFRDAPKLIAASFRESNDQFRIGNEELALMNVRLENDIAVLRGKPRNALKEAIAEATLEADKLAKALNDDVDALYKLLQQNDVGFLSRILGNQAGTTDIKKLVGGDTGVGGLRDQLAEISDEAAQKRAAIPLGNTDTERKTSKAALDQVNSDERTRTEKALADALKTVNAELAKSIDLENKRKAAANAPAPRPNAAGNVLGAAVENAQRDQQNRVVDSQRRVAELRGVRTRLNDELTRVRLTQTNIEDKATKGGLEEQKSTAELGAPFRNKINELGGELEKLQASLNAIGKTDTAQMLARSFGAAQQEIVRLNDELAKHHQALSLDQQVQLQTLYDEVEATKAEEAFQKKFDQTTDSISDRIAALNRLTSAIGQGYEAQRNATVANQLAQEFPAEYRDPQLKARHQGQIDQRKGQLETEYDLQQGLQNEQTFDKLGDQTEMENALAAAERNGAEAVRLETLAQQRLNLERDKGKEAGDALADAEKALSDAQAKRRAEQAASALEQETKATNRVAEAIPQGAEQVRRAQIQNRVEEIQRTTPTGPEQNRQVQAVRDNAEAQRRQEILTGALQTGIAYQNQLSTLNQQIEVLERMKAAGNDTLALNISLKNLEQERTRVLIEQALQVGGVRDGMIAFLRDMATESESAAAKIYGAMKGGVNSLNDTLSRAISGQKVSWQSFFQGLSQQFAKIGLEEAEGVLFRKLGGLLTHGQATVGQAGQAGRAPWDEKIPGAIGGGFGGMLGKLGGGAVGLPGAGKRDGNSDATALIVALSSGSVPTMPTDKPSTPFGKRDGSSPALSLYVTVTNAMGQPQENGWQTASGILGKVAGVAALAGVAGRAQYGGARALGGAVDPHSTFLVGERGPELFRPKVAGTIIPNDKLISAEMETGGIRSLKELLGGVPTPRSASLREAFQARALGGDVDASAAYLVGEQGPEVLTGVTGRIASNSTSRRMLGEQGTNIYYTIDARGTDPVLTEQRTRQAILAAHNSAVVTSIQASTERAKRVAPAKL